MRSWRLASMGSAVALTFLLSGCGGGGSSANNSAGNTGTPAIASAPTAITTTDSGAKAALSGVSITEGAYEVGASANSFQSLGQGLAKETSAVTGATDIAQWMQRLAKDAAPLNSAIQWQKGTAKSVAATMDASSICTSGTATITSDATGASIVYNNCRYGSIQENGTITISGVSSNGTTYSANYSIGSNASPFTTTFYTGPTSNVKEAEDKSVVTMTGFTADSSTGAISATLTGAYTEEDFVANTKTESSISGFKTSYGVVNGIYSVNITGGSFTNKEYTSVNGTYTLQSTKGMTLQNFRVDRNIVADTYTVNGTFAIQSSPIACVDGTFVIKTTTPINYSHTAGAMTINDNTTITFTPTGVTVTVAGQQPKTFSSISELNAVCTEFSI